jgi:acetyl esterase/lipase
MTSAIAWVRANTDALRVDPRRIVAAGFSAGAMAALAATYDKGSPVAAAVALSGAMGVAEMRAHIVGSDQPPAILFRGEYDLPGIEPISRLLDAHMQTVGIDHECHEVEGGTHFYPRQASVKTVDGKTISVEAAIAAFLAKRLARPERH